MARRTQIDASDAARALVARRKRQEYVCALCGVTFEARAGARNETRRYCSPAHRNLAWWREHRKKPVEAEET